MMKDCLDNGEPLDNFWKITLNTLPEGLDVKTDLEILKISS